MAVITISRGAYSRGREIAEKVADRLNYKSISKDLLHEVSKDYNISESKLEEAIHDAPGILTRLKHKEEKYIAFIKSALLNHLKEDNVVYHGLAGHFFVKDVPHALKVRILADMEDRIQLEMERTGIDADKARRMLEKDDEERRKWGQRLYGIDTSDPRLYDLVINVNQLTVDDAADIICESVSKRQYKTTLKSQRMIEDLALSAAIQKALIELAPDIRACVDNRTAYIETEAAVGAEELLVKEIRDVVENIEGISDVKVQCHPIVALSE